VLTAAEQHLYDDSTAAAVTAGSSSRGLIGGYGLAHGGRPPHHHARAPLRDEAQEFSSEDDGDEESNVATPLARTGAWGHRGAPTASSSSSRGGSSSRTASETTALMGNNNRQYRR
jgi:hypothetical protein